MNPAEIGIKIIKHNFEIKYENIEIKIFFVINLLDNFIKQLRFYLKKIDLRFSYYIYKRRN